MLESAHPSFFYFLISINVRIFLLLSGNRPPGGVGLARKGSRHGKNFYISFLTAILSCFGGIAIFIWHIEHRLPSVSYSEFMASLEQGEISEVHLKGGEVTFVDSKNLKLTTFAPDISSMMPRLSVNKVRISAEASPMLPWYLFYQPAHRHDSNPLVRGSATARGTAP